MVVTRKLFLDIITTRRPHSPTSMSDPGTTYRTREEVQRMRSTQDPIRGLQRYIEDWGLATEQDLKVILWRVCLPTVTDIALSNSTRKRRPRLI